MMRSVRSKDTAPELAVRRLIHCLGYRYRLHRSDLPGKPDIVFPGRRKIILVHGCFWHQHPNCKEAQPPSSNMGYWRPKLARNVERDAKNTAALVGHGWDVLVVWECETKNKTALQERLLDFLGAPPSLAH
ncbi:MAG: DNA mismatch endonuclease Vsr [Rhodomicrobium sp.]